MALTTCTRNLHPRSLVFNNLKFDAQGCLLVTASLKLLKPPNYDHVKFPERKRLAIIQKVPHLDTNIKPPRHQKMLIQMRGPEEVHNKLQYGDYGIQAITGGRLKHETCEMIRMIIVRQMDEANMFAVWRHNSLWQSVSKKGIGVRMGGGKGAIDHYVFPFKAERIILEIGGTCEYVEVMPMLKAIQKKLPFRSRLVTHKSMQEREAKEKWEEENNLNPFTFKYCAQNNVLGCRTFLNDYDHKWYGKYL